MGPKKDQLRIKTIKCPYNNRGYCKFGDECTNKHVDKVCNDRDCIEEVSKFGLRWKHNKKKLCSYSHATFVIRTCPAVLLTLICLISEITSRLLWQVLHTLWPWNIFSDKKIQREVTWLEAVFFKNTT